MGDDNECKENTCLDNNNFYDVEYDKDSTTCLKECNNVWYYENVEGSNHKICSDKTKCSETDYKYISPSNNT